MKTKNMTVVVMNTKYKYTAIRPAEKKRGFEFKNLETRKKRDTLSAGIERRS